VSTSSRCLSGGLLATHPSDIGRPEFDLKEVAEEQHGFPETRTSASALDIARPRGSTLSHDAPDPDVVGGRPLLDEMSARRAGDAPSRVVTASGPSDAVLVAHVDAVASGRRPRGTQRRVSHGEQQWLIPTGLHVLPRCVGSSAPIIRRAIAATPEHEVGGQFPADGSQVDDAPRVLMIDDEPTIKRDGWWFLRDAAARGPRPLYRRASVRSGAALSSGFRLEDRSPRAPGRRRGRRGAPGG
jgi:hypothetical protein